MGANVAGQYIKILSKNGGEFEGLTAPVCYIWGDKDHAATAEVQDVYPKLAQKIKCLEVHLLPGILHGYMNTLDNAAYDAGAYKFSMQHALAILSGLHDY